MTKQETKNHQNFIEMLLKSNKKQDLLDLKENELNDWINDLNIANPIYIKKLKIAIKELKEEQFGTKTIKGESGGYGKLISNVTCKVYKAGYKLPNISNHVFISKQATQDLSEYIVQENWGKNNILLYKYLDYIWRLQLIDKMVKLFWFKNEKRLIFNTGLYTKQSNDEVFLCLVPNDINPNKKKYSQPWRVTLGDYGLRYCSFMTKKQLIAIHGLRDHDIPMRTTFDENLVKFKPEYNISINLFDRVRTAKDRIMETLRDDIGFYGKLSQMQLESLVDSCIINTLNEARNNPDICAKQVFMERDLVNNKKLTKGYHLELLLPLTLNINNCSAYFAIVLRINDELKEYEIMSIITREMAYSNARLIGYVNTYWLKPFVNTNKLILPSLPFNNNGHDNHCFQNMINTQNGLNNINNYNNNNNNIMYNPLDIINLFTMLRLTLPQQLN